MSMFKIVKLIVEKSYDGKHLMFSGYFRKRMFFGSNECGKLRIINNNDFYEFEQEHILKYINNYLNK